MSPAALTWGVAALPMLAALWLAWPLYKRRHRRRSLEKSITNTATARLRHVLLDNGMGGQTFFDWLLLTPQGIQVLTVNRRDGTIFAGERMDSWAQLLGRRTVHFTNPLHALEGALATLRYHLPGIPVSAYILFIGDCRFPKGRPEAVITPQELVEHSTVASGTQLAPGLAQAWSVLEEKARKVDPATEGYLLPLADEAPTRRWLLILLLLLGTAGWLLWRLV